MMVWGEKQFRLKNSDEELFLHEMSRSRLLNEIACLLFPDKCVGCDLLCSAPICPRCFFNLVANVNSLGCAPEQDFVIAGKRHVNRALSGVRVRAGGTYRGSLKSLVLGLKNSGMRFALPLCELMVIAAGNDPSFICPDIVTFVPTTKRKMKMRGFNPSEVLSALLCERLDLPLVAALEVRRSVKDQDGLSAQERWENANGAFGLRPGFEKLIPGLRVLIVDDVITTGATIWNCAVPFFEHGAKEVCALIAAASAI